MKREMKRYIDADAFYEHIENMPRGERYFGNIQDDLKVFPTADVAPVVHAKWMGGGGLCSPYCSNCKKYSPRGERFNYCPHCGAKMDEDGDDE